MTSPCLCHACIPDMQSKHPACRRRSRCLRAQEGHAQGHGLNWGAPALLPAPWQQAEKLKVSRTVSSGMC